MVFSISSAAWEVSVSSTPQQGAASPHTNTNAARNPAARFIPQALLVSLVPSYVPPGLTYAPKVKSVRRGDFRLAMAGKV